MPAKTKTQPKYTKAQLDYWKRKPKDYRSGSTRAGTAEVLCFVASKGTCLVPLSSIGSDGEYHPRYQAWSLDRGLGTTPVEVMPLDDVKRELIELTMFFCADEVPYTTEEQDGQHADRQLALYRRVQRDMNPGRKLDKMFEDQTPAQRWFFAAMEHAGVRADVTPEGD